MDWIYFKSILDFSHFCKICRFQFFNLHKTWFSGKSDQSPCKKDRNKIEDQSKDDTPQISPKAKSQLSAVFNPTASAVVGDRARDVRTHGKSCKKLSEKHRDDAEPRTDNPTNKIPVISNGLHVVGSSSRVRVSHVETCKNISLSTGSATTASTTTEKLVEKNDDTPSEKNKIIDSHLPYPKVKESISSVSDEVSTKVVSNYIFQSLGAKIRPSMGKKKNDRQPALPTMYGSDNFSTNDLQIENSRGGESRELFHRWKLILVKKKAKLLIRFLEMILKTFLIATIKILLIQEMKTQVTHFHLEVHQ